MIKLNSYSNILDIQRIQDYSDPNGGMGVEIQIYDDAGFMQRFTDMEDKINLLEAEHLREQALLTKHPAIKDLHDQYKAMVKLAIENEKQAEPG